MKNLKLVIILTLIVLPTLTFADTGALKFSGDLRLRYEYKDADGAMNRGRARFRLRLNGTTQIDENWTVGFSLASGSDADPTSTNQSMDNNFQKKNIWIDRAYATYKSGNFTFTGGKMHNPFVTTDVIWDSDINLEGLAEKWTFGKNAYITLGQMVLTENSSASDAYMLAAQGGIILGKGSINLAYYTFSNYVENSPAARGNLFENNVSYSLIDLLAKYHVTHSFSVWGQYVTNVDATKTSTGSKEDTAMGIGATYKYDDWKFGVKYADIKPNAVVGAFSDSDFGYGNRKGFKVSAERKLRKNVALAVAFFDTKHATDGEGQFKMVQFDLKFKF